MENGLLRLDWPLPLRLLLLLLSLGAGGTVQSFSHRSRGLEDMPAASAE